MSLSQDINDLLLFAISLIGPVLAIFLGIYLLANPKNRSKRIIALAGFSLSLAATLLSWIFWTPWLFCITIFLAALFWMAFLYGETLPKKMTNSFWAVLFSMFTLTLLAFNKTPTAATLGASIFYLAVLVLTTIYKTNWQKNLKKNLADWMFQLGIAQILLVLYLILSLMGILTFSDGAALLFSALVFFFGGWGIIHANIINELKPKYQNRAISISKIDKGWQNLEDAMQQQKLFTDSELNVEKVGKHIGISAKEVSQIINQKTTQNYTHYINGYRVDLAKRLLTDPAYQQLKIAAIAYDCGFNSTSAFNAAFKKATGTSPSAYRKQKRQDMP